MIYWTGQKDRLGFFCKKNPVYTMEYYSHPGERGQYRGAGVGGTNYWLQDGLKDVLYNVGNIVNIL